MELGHKQWKGLYFKLATNTPIYFLILATNDNGENSDACNTNVNLLVSIPTKKWKCWMFLNQFEEVWKHIVHSIVVVGRLFEHLLPKSWTIPIWEPPRQTVWNKLYTYQKIDNGSHDTNNCNKMVWSETNMNNPKALPRRH